MAKTKKVTKALAKKVLEHWKSNCITSGFINESFKALNVNPVDFQLFLSDDSELQELYDKYYNAIFAFKEDEQAKIAYSNSNPNSRILLRMIEGRNRKMYDRVIKNNEDPEIVNKTDEEIDNEISIILNAIKDKDKLMR